LIHVYAKHYEANGHLILIRVVRYSLDGDYLHALIGLMLIALRRFDPQSSQYAILRKFRNPCLNLESYQAVFLAYMVVLKKGVNVGLAAVLIVLTSIIKILSVPSLLIIAVADIYI
jgi:hypothetical protein